MNNFNYKKTKIFKENDNFIAKKFVSDFGTNIILMDVTKKVPTHTTPVNVIFIVKSGKGYIIIGDEKIEVEEDSVINSPKNVPHSLESIENFKVYVIKINETKK